MSTMFVTNVDWTKLWITVGTVAVIWSSLGTIIPQKYYTVVMTILSAAQAGLTFAMRSGKYVADRGNIPNVGERP